MSSIVWLLQFLALAATARTASLTTTVAIPFQTPGTQNTRWASTPSFKASVVDVHDATTTLHAAWDDNFLTYLQEWAGADTINGTWTWVVGPTTFAEIWHTTSVDGKEAPMTLPCSVASSTAFCLPEPVDASLQFSLWCSRDGALITATADTVTYEVPVMEASDTTEWSAFTMTADTGFCSTAEAVPLELQYLTQSPMGDVQIVITAGEEKLEPTSAGSLPGKTAGATSTGVAPRMTVGPVLAGLGAAAALVL